MANQRVLEKKSPSQRNHPDIGCSQGTVAAAAKNCDPLTMDKTLEETLNGPDLEIVLSKRERQILAYIVEGNTNKEIAQKLYRTQRTVEYHRNRLMRKLDSHTTAELVKRAIVMGMV